jgi:hypothetical protein
MAMSIEVEFTKLAVFAGLAELMRNSGNQIRRAKRMNNPKPTRICKERERKR